MTKDLVIAVYHIDNYAGDETLRLVDVLVDAKKIEQYDTSDYVCKPMQLVDCVVE